MCEFQEASKSSELHVHTYMLLCMGIRLMSIR